MLWHFPIVEAARLRPGRPYCLAFRGDLNPISEELMADVRAGLPPAPGIFDYVEMTESEIEALERLRSLPVTKEFLHAAY